MTRVKVKGIFREIKQLGRERWQFCIKSFFNTLLVYIVLVPNYYIKNWYQTMIKKSSLEMHKREGKKNLTDFVIVCEEIIGPRLNTCPRFLKDPRCYGHFCCYCFYNCYLSISNCLVNYRWNVFKVSISIFVIGAMISTLGSSLQGRKIKRDCGHNVFTF